MRSILMTVLSSAGGTRRFALLVVVLLALTALVAPGAAQAFPWDFD